MRVHDVMARRLGTVTPLTTIQEIAEKMASLGVGFLPVCEAKYPVGVITDRDIVFRVVASDRHPQESLARDIMTLDVETVWENQTVEEAVRIMHQKQLHQLLVLDENNQMLGIVSLEDIAVGSRDKKLSGETLKGISDSLRFR